MAKALSYPTNENGEAVSVDALDILIHRRIFYEGANWKIPMPGSTLDGNKFSVSHTISSPCAINNNAREMNILIWKYKALGPDSHSAG